MTPAEFSAMAGGLIRCLLDAGRPAGDLIRLGFAIGQEIEAGQRVPPDACERMRNLAQEILGAGSPGKA